MLYVYYNYLKFEKYSDSLSQKNNMIFHVSSNNNTKKKRKEDESHFICITEQHYVSNYFTRLWSVRAQTSAF